MMEGEGEGAEVMQLGGDADKTVKGRANQLRIFEEWRVAHPRHTQLCPLPWDQSGPESLTHREVWGSLATFLVTHYKSSKGSNKGKPLDLSSAILCWSGLMNQAAGKCKSTETAVRLLVCSHLRTEPALARSDCSPALCACSSSSRALAGTPTPRTGSGSRGSKLR